MVHTIQCTRRHQSGTTIRQVRSHHRNLPLQGFKNSLCLFLQNCKNSREHQLHTQRNTALCSSTLMGQTPSLVLSLYKKKKKQQGDVLLIHPLLP